MKQAYLREMSKSPPRKSVVIPDPLSPTPSTSSDMRIPDSGAADEGYLQMEYCSDYRYRPNTGAETNSYL
jgi:hypothetical protein